MRRKVECEEKRENKRNNLEHDKNIWHVYIRIKGKEKNKRKKIKKENNLKRNKIEE